jgi:hypothetical protein
MVAPIWVACSCVTEITTDVAVLSALIVGFGWRKRAEAMVMFAANCIADFIVSSRSLGSVGIAKRGMP